MITKFKSALTVISIVSLTACATNPSSIAPSYVSATSYRNMSCTQLETEAQAISARAAQASSAQSQQVGRDAVAVGVSAILFWPALFFIGGDGREANEIARLKGEMQAIETVNREKNCGIVFDRDGDS